MDTAERERALLNSEAEEAIRLLKHRLHEMQEDLKASVDVGAWAKEKPFLTVGAAAIAGFAASKLIGRQNAASRDEQSAHPPEPISHESPLHRLLTPLADALGASIPALLSSYLQGQREAE